MSRISELKLKVAGGSSGTTSPNPVTRKARKARPGAMTLTGRPPRPTPSDADRLAFLKKMNLPLVSTVKDAKTRAEGSPDRMTPTKFTPDRVKIILWALDQGNYRVTAAHLAGVTYPTFRNWMEKGEIEEVGPFRQFHDSVIQAEAKSESQLLHLVHVQVPTDWKAGMEILKRRHSDRWGKESREITGASGGPIQIKVVYEDEPGKSEEDSGANASRPQ